MSSSETRAQHTRERKGACEDVGARGIVFPPEEPEDILVGKQQARVARRHSRRKGCHDQRRGRGGLIWEPEWFYLRGG